MRLCRTSKWAMLALPHAHLNTGKPADSVQYYTAWSIAGSPQIEGFTPVLRVPARQAGVGQNRLCEAARMEHSNARVEVERVTPRPATVLFSRNI